MDRERDEKCIARGARVREERREVNDEVRGSGGEDAMERAQA